jgi:hypothetical protein
MEAIRTSEISLLTRATGRNIPEGVFFLMNSAVKKNIILTVITWHAAQAVFSGF